MQKKTLGRASIRIDSKIVDSEPGAELVVGGIKNNSRQTTSKHYYNQTMIPSRITCRVPFTADVSLRDLQSLAEVDVTFTSDTGQIYMIRDAVQTSEIAVTDGDAGGFASLVFEGDPAEEIK